MQRCTRKSLQTVPVGAHDRRMKKKKREKEQLKEAAGCVSAVMTDVSPTAGSHHDPSESHLSVASAPNSPSAPPTPRRHREHDAKRRLHPEMKKPLGWLPAQPGDEDKQTSASRVSPLKLLFFFFSPRHDSLNDEFPVSSSRHGFISQSAAQSRFCRSGSI